MSIKLAQALTATGELLRDPADFAGGVRLFDSVADTRLLRFFYTRMLADLTPEERERLREHTAIPEGLQINHKDLDKQNNRPSNLELVTGTENAQHAQANGCNRGWSQVDRHTGLWRGKPLVTPERKAEVRASRASGMMYRDIADLYGISISHIHRICTK